MVNIPAGGFLFLRHGQTEANAADIICGQTDLPLNAAGQAQAAQTADFLRGTALSRIICSRLGRARQTAQIVADRLGLPAPEMLDGLGERNWGAWEGQPRAILRRDETPPGGESPADFRARIQSAFASIDPLPGALIVAHSGTDREIHAALADTPHRRLANAELICWAPEADGWNCHEFFKPVLYPDADLRTGDIR